MKQSVYFFLLTYETHPIFNNIDKIKRSQKKLQKKKKNGKSERRLIL